MTFSIGRAGRTLTLNGPSDWTSASFGSSIKGQGGDVVVSGVVSGLTPAQAVVLRDQLEGYQDNWDEPVVPVIVDAESRRTGYYAVAGVETLTDVETVGYGTLKYTVGLQPVMGFSQPLMECIVTDALLTNAVGALVGDVIGLHGYPGSALEYSPSTTGTLTTTRTSADGLVNVFYNPAVLSFTTRFGLPPASFYVGAATFEQGSPLQPVVGRMLVQPDPVNWRLSNGFIRITPNGSQGKLDFSFYNGTTWSAVKTFAFTQSGLNPPSWTTVTVLRNAVEETVIRLGSTLTGGSFGSTLLDISLRRGDRIARLYFNSTLSSAWRVARDTAEAATAITFGAVTAGGMRATANDGDGNRFVLVSYQAATTSDLVGGSLTLNPAGKAMDMGIGYSVGASALPNDAPSLAQEYIAAVSEEQRVVAR